LKISKFEKVLPLSETTVLYRAVFAVSIITSQPVWSFHLWLWFKWL